MSDKTELDSVITRIHQLDHVLHGNGYTEKSNARRQLFAILHDVCGLADRAAIQSAAAEPVAWCVANPNGTVPPVLIFGNGEALKPGDKLYPGPVVAPADAVRDARNEALEEAAKEADAHNYGPLGEYDYSYDDAKSNADDRAEEIARAIRDLKSTLKEPAK